MILNIEDCVGLPLVHQFMDGGLRGPQIGVTPRIRALATDIVLDRATPYPRRRLTRNVRNCQTRATWLWAHVAITDNEQLMVWCRACAGAGRAPLISKLLQNLLIRRPEEGHRHEPSSPIR